VEEAIDASHTDTVVVQDKDIILSMESTAENCNDRYLENLGGNSDTMETVMNSCELSDDVEQIIEEHLSEPSRPTRRNRSSLTGQLRAILTGSSETSVREFYLDLHSPLSVQGTTENIVSEEIELLHYAEEDIPLHCTDPTESIIVHTGTTSTDEVTAVVIPSNVPHVTTRKSLRLRKRLIYYR
jgi:hypothetical protein